MSKKAFSIGKSIHHPGKKTENQLDEKFVLDNSREYYLLDVIPFGAVRMTKRDRIFLNPNHPDPKKRQRQAVADYFEFKTQLMYCAYETQYKLDEVPELVFFIPMPQSWSDKKKVKMNGTKHEVKPDIDNLVKGFFDALTKNDGNIWKINAKKYWAHKGSILIYK